MAKKGGSKKKASAAKPAPVAEPSEPIGTDEPDQVPAWFRLHLWQIQGVRDVLIVLLVVGLFWLGQKISIVTVPLLLALLFAYLFEPVIQLLMRKTRLQRHGAVGAIIAAVVLCVVVPASVGVTYGILQAAGLLTSIANSSQAVWASVQDDRELSVAEDKLRLMKQPQEPGDDTGNATSTDDDTTLEDDATPDDDAKPGVDTTLDDDASPADTTPSNDVSQDETTSEGDAAPTDGSPQTSDVEQGKLSTEAAINEQEAEVERLRREATKSRESVPERWMRLHDELIARRDSGSLDESFGTLQGWIRANADNVAGTAANAGVSVVERTIRMTTGTFGFLFMLFLTAFFFYFMSTGWVQVKGLGVKLLPERNKGQIIHLATEFDRVISAFIRGRLTIAFIQSIVFTIGYALMGVPAAFIVGPLVALLSIVPYLALVGIPVSITLLWLEAHTGFRGHWLWIIGAPTVFYFMVQSLDDYLLTPWIQGKSTDMSTPMILFASLAGGVLFGVFGLLIAIPIAACIKILIKEIVWPRFKAWTEGEADDFLPIKRE